MKTVYIDGGTMGIGKTTVCRQMKNQLNNSVFLDGDWCWGAHPFQVTDKTKRMVMHNIWFLLNQFIHCSVKIISLISGEEELRKRLMEDIAAGKRTADVMERSISYIPNYQKLNSMKIYTDGKSSQEVTDEILCL